MSAKKYSQFFGDFFLASSKAEKDVSIPKTCVCFNPSVLDIIPIEEPYSTTKFFAGILEIYDLMFL